MRGMIFALGLAAAMCAGEAVAADAPISPPSPLIGPDTGNWSHATFSRHFTVGSLKGDIGGTPLSAIARQVGGQVQSGGAGSADMQQWLCYDLPSAHQRIWLSITDEDGNGKTTGMITAVPLTDRDPHSPTCTPLAKAATPLVIDDGIKLGMTRAQLTARLGAPSKDVSGWLVYRANPKINGASVITSLTVHVEADRVVFLEAFMISTD